VATPIKLSRLLLFHSSLAINNSPPPPKANEYAKLRLKSSSDSVWYKHSAIIVYTRQSMWNVNQVPSLTFNIVAWDFPYITSYIIRLNLLSAWDNRTGAWNILTRRPVKNENSYTTHSGNCIHFKSGTQLSILVCLFHLIRVSHPYTKTATVLQFFKLGFLFIWNIAPHHWETDDRRFGIARESRNMYKSHIYAENSPKITESSTHKN
jgi:hypothetical protein